MGSHARKLFCRCGTIRLKDWGQRAGITQLPSWAGNEIPHELARLSQFLFLSRHSPKNVQRKEGMEMWKECVLMPLSSYGIYAVYIVCRVYCRTARPFVWEEGTTKAKQNGVQTVATFPDPSERTQTLRQTQTETQTQTQSQTGTPQQTPKTFASRSHFRSEL